MHIAKSRFELACHLFDVGLLKHVDVIAGGIHRLKVGNKFMPSRRAIGPASGRPFLGPDQQHSSLIRPGNISRSSNGEGARKITQLVIDAPVRQNLPFVRGAPP